MNERIKQIIINNFYEQSNAYFSEQLKLDQETIEELFSNNPTIFKLNKRDTRIIREVIGMYDNGLKKPKAQIARIVKVSPQRIHQVIKKSIIYIYNIDYKIKTEKAKTNKSQEIALKNSNIDILPLNKEIIKKIKSKGYIKIKDFEGQSKESIIELCERLEIDYFEQEKIFKYLNLIGINLPKKRIIGTIISKIDVSEETYRFLQVNEINTYEELKENIDLINYARKINLDIKNEIETLYNNYLLGNIKNIKKSTEDAQIYKNLIDEKEKERISLEELQKQKNVLYKLIDKIISSEKNVTNKTKAILELYELINETDERISTINEAIKKINNEIGKHTERIIKKISI